MTEQRITALGLFRTTVVFGAAAITATLAAVGVLTVEHRIPELSASVFQALAPTHPAYLRQAMILTAAPVQVMERCVTSLLFLALTGVASLWACALACDWAAVCVQAFSRLSQRK